ncbi:MAG: DUF1223 domain-containing protein [Pseudomonadota bacterium]
MLVSSSHAGSSPVLVELFTAENCPACPPAEEYLKKLDQSKNIIALSCPVDYFGRGGTGIGQAFCSGKQNLYREILKRPKLYTPQMMINGRLDEIGYETDKVAAKISKAKGDQLRSIKIIKHTAQVFAYELPSISFLSPVQIWIASYKKPFETSRRGQKREFTNVIQNFISLGEWSGQYQRQAISPVINSQTAGFVIAAQNLKTGQVVALGEYKF